MSYDHWNNLPRDILIDVVHRLSSRKDYFRFTAVCKSWNSAACEAVASLADSVISEKPWWLLLRLPTTTPMLLLAEEVAPGSILNDTEFDLNKDYAYDKEGYYKENDDDNIGSYDYLKNSVGTIRGLYSLSSMKTYNIELPEAAGKLILGTNKGWLLTLGRDLEINLLHPLLRHQISLPPMLKFPRQCVYNERHTPEDDSEQFIRKVAMSSKLPNKDNDGSFSSHHSTPSPIVMVIYQCIGVLGFARLGDKVWTDVDVSSDYFHDIVYHKGNFYAVNSQGDVYVCHIDDHQERGAPRATKIASLFRTDYSEQKYLVEPLSGSGLLLLVRYDREMLIRRGLGRPSKYRTTNFDVWRLDLEYCDSHQIPIWRWDLEYCDPRQIPKCPITRENNLGNEAIFVGRASSLSVPSSDIIKPNSIYFTDDNWDAYFRLGGGHDMGIFDLEHRTVEPHYQGKSIHCISPPLWYI